jgi:hypothetical protein
MDLFKRPPIRLQKLTKAANGASCVRCGRDDGTVVAAHYQGIGSHRLGKGRGIKPHDYAAADLCGECHQYFDSYESGNDYERAWEFLMLCMETMERRFRDGIIR